ncbi:MAG: AAA family ATPase [Ardenticatenaceae bacterium]|nr:AAA family ATPase [Ardenticatenaceae bacterium]
MAHLRLSFLGSPEVWYGQQALTFATRKVLALLIYLTVEEGRHPREKLATLFWPESDPLHGRGALRTTLAHLRRTLDKAVPPGSQAYLVVEADALGFHPTSDFELDLRTVGAALGAEQSGLLQEAIHLYRGDFLEGFALPDAPTFDEWVTFQREHWHHQMNVVFDRLSRWQSAGRHFEEGIVTAVRWVAHDPLNEAAHRRLMQLHMLAGNRTAALQAYRACRTILAKELAAEPSPETETLHERIRSTKGEGGTLRVKDEDRIYPLSFIPHPSSFTHFPFVGRMAEHLQLATAYHTARQGQAQVVLIEGEAGIGKTRLATEFLAWAALHGPDVLRGRAFEAGGRLPYQPLVEALRRRVEQENAPEDLLSDVWLAELSRLLPELRDRYPDLPPSTGDETLARTRLLEAVARLGQVLAARAPVILFIDDIQWADTASLDVLHYCGRAWTESHTPILLLLTIRSEALATTPTLGEWRLELGRDVSLMRLALGPISAGETQELAEALIGVQDRRRAFASFAEWLFAETAGQPFYITEMIKTLMEQGVLQSRPDEKGTWAVDWQMGTQPAAALQGLIPQGVREVILTRLRRLTSNATALLTAAAVIGRDCSFERLCQVAGISAGEGLPALDELLAGRLLVETDDPIRPYTFAHDKTRDVVYTEAGAARRRLYHRQAFTVLEATAAPAELAHHALAARLTEPAFRYSLAAGDAAMALFAVRDAIVYYEQARDQLSAISDQLSVADSVEHLSLRLGRAYELVGEYQHAETIYREMLALAQASSRPEMACIALNRLGTVAVHTYEFETAAAWLQQALSVAEESDNKAALAETEWSLAQLAYHTFDYPTTVRHSQQAVALARELGNQELMAGSLNTLAYAEFLLGQVRACQAHMEEAKTRYATLGNRALEADCLTIIALVKMCQGQLEAGIADAHTAYTISQEIDNPWGQIASSAVLAFGLMDKGDYEEALRFARQGRQQAQAHDMVLVSFLNLLVFGMVYRALLASESARAAHLEAAGLNERAGSQSFAEMTAAQLCADCALAGDWEAATRYARQALASRKYTALPLVISPRWPETEALLRGGEVELAREDVRTWGELVSHIPRYRLPHLHSLALLAEWDGDMKQAITHLEEALSLAEQIGLPGEEWPILAKLGELYRANGDEEQAQRAFGKAAEIIQALAAKIDDEDLRAGFLAACGIIVSNEDEH